MRIIFLKPGHDGSIAFLDNGNLLFSLEGKKNSFKKHEYLTPNSVLDGMSYFQDLPDVFALSGWLKGLESEVSISDIEAGYFGIDNKSIIWNESTFLGKNIKRFSSSHERSHVMCSYGMSHFEQGEPCYLHYLHRKSFRTTRSKI